MPKKGSRRKKTRTHVKPSESSANPNLAKVPKSFVVKSGTVGGSVTALTKDVRKVLEPNTGTRLRERKANRLRDYVSMSGPLGVTHLIVFSQPSVSNINIPGANSTDPKAQSQQERSAAAEKSLLAGTTTLNMRLIRLPRGPTLSFKVLRYSLASDILRMARRPRSVGREFAEAPLLILSGFGGENKELKLMTTVFQNLFPPIHVQTMPLSSARRVVLLSYNSVTMTVDFRHYLISVRPVGISKPIRKVITGSTTNRALLMGSKKRPRSSVGSSDEDEDNYVSTTAANGPRGKGILDLSRAEDISDYILRHEGMGFVTSDSEASDQSDGGSTHGSQSGSEEDERKGKVRLPGDYIGRGNRGKGVRGEKRAVRLVELGPRLELGLVKIEEGVGEGEVMFHQMVHKSTSEAAQLSKTHAARRKLIAERRAEQAANVAAKKAAKAAAEGEQKVVRMDEDAGEEEEVDEEEEEERIDSDNSFDYEEQHGLRTPSSEDDLEDAASESENEIDGQENAASDSEDSTGLEDENDSDLSPIPYHSGEESSDDEEEEEEDNESMEQKILLPPARKIAPGGARKNPAISFSHKGFKKKDPKPLRPAIGIALPRPPTKKEKQREQEFTRKNGKGKDDMTGRYEEREERGTMNGSSARGDNKARVSSSGRRGSFAGRGRGSSRGGRQRGA